MSLLEKLKAGVKNVKSTTWPGTDDKIGLRVITEEEAQQAAISTEQLFKDEDIAFSAGIADAYQAEQDTQTLALALLDENGKRLFKNADELRTILTNSVKEALIDELNSWQQECSPSLGKMSEEEYDKLFEDIKKNPSITNSLNSRTQRGLIIFLANRPQNSRQDNGPTSD